MYAFSYFRITLFPVMPAEELPLQLSLLPHLILFLGVKLNTFSVLIRSSVTELCSAEEI